MAKNKQGVDIEAVQFLAQFAYDPYKFVLAAFPWGEPGPLENMMPQPWQRDILNEIRDGFKTSTEAIQEAVASGHGIGKSALVSWIILWAMSTHEDTRGVVTANTDGQLKSKTWAELSTWYQRFICKEMFVLTATSLFANQPGHEKTWRIDAIPWSERNTEAFAGLHNHGKRILIIFDEASAIIDKIWEVTEGAMSDKDTEKIWVAFGNPTRTSGRFYDCFHKFRKYWKTRQIDSRNVEITDKKKINDWLEAWGEDSDFFKVRVRGVFPAASDSQFISRAIVDEAVKRVPNPGLYKKFPVGIIPAHAGLTPPLHWLQN